ncbi:hypothetical protein [Tsukamurella soli]|uniref:Uncharacterized protein n=1 Tax=Tsukamurella soli TaxID=644556 RepID=A0ABP8J5S1_9ACTN
MTEPTHPPERPYPPDPYPPRRPEPPAPDPIPTPEPGREPDPIPLPNDPDINPPSRPDIVE